MPKRAKCWRLFGSLLLLAIFVSMPLMVVAESTPPELLSYEVQYASEVPSTPLEWYHSIYFDNPDYKENRFVQYWWETPIEPGGPRDTGFYMLYGDDGLTIFFQSNESERDESDMLLNSSIEFFIKYGEEDLPYHQMIIHTDGSPAEYYEWQTEHRHNRPLEGNIILENAEIPSGWGTVVKIPWENVYEHVPLNGEDWQFAMIRWSPSHSPTWGGRVHQIGRFNTLDFVAPTTDQQLRIQKHVIHAAWESFQQSASELALEWQERDANFYEQDVQPLIDAGQALGVNVPHLDSLSEAEIDDLYTDAVPAWYGLKYDVEEARVQHLKRELFNTSDEGEPVTTLLLEPAEPNGSNGWYTSDVTMTLTADSDGGGSIAYTEYRLNDGTWMIYDGPVTLEDEGVYTLEFRSVNGKGVVEETHSKTIRLDKTAPSFTVSVEPDILWPPNNKFVTIYADIDADDEISGIDEVKLMSITHDEQGHTGIWRDVRDAQYGTADSEFKLRARRFGYGDGRTYSILYTATDLAGLTTCEKVEVEVPKRKHDE